MPPSGHSVHLITGVVEDTTTGRPVPEASVYLTAGPEPRPDIAALSRADGSFTLSVRGEGVYAVQCRTPDDRIAEATVTAGGDSPARVRLRV
ncbi:carboxypeptidase regulatory-like domain-containing protein [Streptomyces sp. NPDC005890]|uniref:carboxypeptidase-like regulatory domain-containing protein n=1 Tax=Streptomyces sp. NPDC005890 TaxID=3154568 RepID=UPI0033F9346D